MNVKSFAVAAALLTASAFGSQASTFQTTDGSATGYAGILSAYVTWADTWTQVFNGIYGANSEGTYWSLSGLGNYAAKLSSSITVNIPRSSVFQSMDFDAINFRVVGTGATATASYASYVATVPSPEAGAGMGAVALGGLAIWIARRRKEEIAA